MKLLKKLMPHILEKAAIVVAGEKSREDLIDYIERLYAKHEVACPRGLAKVIALGAMASARLHVQEQQQEGNPDARAESLETR